MSMLVRSNRMKHVRGLVRAAGYLAATCLVFGAYSVKVARAETRDRTLALGREMLDFAPTTSNEITPIIFNGQKLFLGSSVTDESPTAVLDRYESACKADPGQPARGWQELMTQGKPLPQNAPEIMTGSMRNGDDKEGNVVCFVRGENTKPSLQEAVMSLTSTGELGALGKLRYVYAKKTESGHTHVLTAWTDDRFNLREMMPSPTKDAPGADFPELPRVPNAIRALSVTSPGKPYGVNVYKTTDAPAQTLSFYDREMVKEGWIGYDPKTAERGIGAGGRSYLKDGVVLTLATTIKPEGNFVTLGLAGVHVDPTVSN